MWILSLVGFLRQKHLPAKTGVLPGILLIGLFKAKSMMFRCAFLR
jgi:hypothetical protein